MEYVSRDDALRFARKAYSKGLDIIEYLEEVPAADVQPVVHGRWDGYGTCSACGDPWDLLMTNDGDDTGYWYEMPPFCPNCGAKMDGET